MRTRDTDEDCACSFRPRHFSGQTAPCALRCESLRYCGWTGYTACSAPLQTARPEEVRRPVEGYAEPSTHQCWLRVQAASRCQANAASDVRMGEKKRCKATIAGRWQDAPEWYIHSVWEVWLSHCPSSCRGSHSQPDTHVSSAMPWRPEDTIPINPHAESHEGRHCAQPAAAGSNGDAETASRSVSEGTFHS